MPDSENHSTPNFRPRQERAPRIIQDCLDRHEQQYARLIEMCLNDGEPATPFIAAMGRKVVDELRDEMLRPYP